jgi:tetratricopeptide (TPR) repeat protein
MRMWEPGDPIEGGNATGIPDVDYFDYLRVESDDDYYRNNDDHDSTNQDYNDYTPKERTYTFDELLKIAKESFDKGDYGEALDYYNQALDRCYDEGAKYGKAECLRKLGRNDEASQLYYELGDRYAWGNDDKNIAVKYLKKAIECNPNNEDALNTLAYSLKGLKRYDEALTYYGRIKHKDVGWAMAMCYMELKKYRSAIPLLDKVIKECPHCDNHLDEKCECLIGLHRKDEAVNLWKQFIDFLMKEECYERALERLDLLSKNTQNEDIFINDRREKCLREKENLEIRFKAILKVMSNYRMYNPNGLDENDLYGFMKFVCEESGESVDDIVRWYETPMLCSSSFKAICGGCLHYSHWDKIVDMYEEGKFRDL